MKLLRILTISIIVLLIALVVSCVDNDLIDDIPEDANPPVELGSITEDLFSLNKTPNSTDTDPYRFQQVIRFSVSKYSRITFSTEIPSGEFSLMNTTKNERRSDDGGSLGGGSNILRFSDGLNFETELDEGEHELLVQGIFNSNQETYWELTIEDIEELRPYENLGVLTLPFNESFVPNPKRSRRTVYDFEILDNIYWNIYTNGTALAYYNKTQTFLFNEEGETIYDNRAQEPELELKKGKYTLSFDSTTTLILGPNDFGDQELGAISSFPFLEEFSIDFTYETNSEQRINFQTTEPTNLIFTAIDSAFLSFSLKNADGTNAIALSSSEVLPAGSYYILITPDSFAYGVDDFIYKIIKGAIKLELIATN